MKAWKLYLFIFILIATSCGKRTRDAVPADIASMIKRYPKLFPYNSFHSYQFVREVFASDSLRMRLYDRENSGDEAVEFINKTGESYAFPIPSNSNSAYWKFYGDLSHNTSDGKNFESEIKKAFKVLSLDKTLGEIIFHNLTVSLFQTHIVMRRDIYSQLNAKGDTNKCDTLYQRGLRIMYIKVWVGMGLPANTFYDYNHGRYYQFKSNMPYHKGGFTIIVYREPCWVEPMYL